MAAADLDERPGIEEKLLCAANTSNMVMEADRGGQGDVIAAAGFAARDGARLGIALLHLQSEWDKAAKPRKRTAAEIAQRASELPPTKKGKPDLARAEAEAIASHGRAMRERSYTLAGRNAVLGLLTDWARERGVDVNLLSNAMFHWLSPQCPVCNGLRFKRMVESPALSKEVCAYCDGKGTWPRPLGAQAIHDHIKTCVGVAKGRMVSKLRG